MNNIAIFQFNEVYQPNGVQNRASTEVCGGKALPLRIFAYKDASVAFVWVLKICTHQYLYMLIAMLFGSFLYQKSSFELDMRIVRENKCGFQLSFFPSARFCPGLKKHFSIRFQIFRTRPLRLLLAAAPVAGLCACGQYNGIFRYSCALYYWTKLGTAIPSASKTV